MNYGWAMKASPSDQNELLVTTWAYTIRASLSLFFYDDKINPKKKKEREETPLPISTDH